MQEPGGIGQAANRAMAVYNKIVDPVQFVINFGDTLFNSGMFGCKNKDQGRTLALTCLTEGISPFRIKQRYHLIAGNFSMRADAMLAGLVKIGGKYRIKRRTSENASIEIEVGEETQTFNLSWSDAKKEPFCYETNKKGQPVPDELKKNWRTPRARMQMLWARVVSDGVRAMAPQVVVGSYTPEELVDVLDLNPDEYNVIEPDPDVSNDTLVGDDAEDQPTNVAVESGEGKTQPEQSIDAPDQGQEETPTDSTARPASPEPAPPIEPEVSAEEPPPFKPPETPDAEPVPMCDQAQMKEMLAYVQRLRIAGDKWRKSVLVRYGVDRAQALTWSQANEILLTLAGITKRHGNDHVQLMKELDQWTAHIVAGEESEAGGSS